MKQVNVCVPVLRRYDLLRDLIGSLEASTIRPTIYIINNGSEQQIGYLSPLTTIVHRPQVPMGVAESWNWFIKNVPEERVITNDDVMFAPDSLERLVKPDADLVWAAGCGFSCFVIRDTCVEKIGLFDETISPGYGYYEDEDYLQRIDGKGTKPPKISAADVDSGVRHTKSQTLAASTPEELREHHRKFWIAQTNYVEKWGLHREFGR